MQLDPRETKRQMDAVGERRSRCQCATSAAIFVHEHGGCQVLHPPLRGHRQSL